MIALLLNGKACSPEIVNDLCRTSGMRLLLSSQGRKLARLGLKIDGVTPVAPPYQVSQELLSRYNREQLYEKVWSQPAQKVALEYRVSGVALGKVCRKLKVPLPGRGYWAKKYAGRPVPKGPPLPTLGLEQRNRRNPESRNP